MKSKIYIEFVNKSDAEFSVVLLQYDLARCIMKMGEAIQTLVDSIWNLYEYGWFDVYI